MDTPSDTPTNPRLYWVYGGGVSDVPNFFPIYIYTRIRVFHVYTYTYDYSHIYIFIFI
nr:MAG TPA: hypothetical protein [Caudoviricetes sp.]